VTLARRIEPQARFLYRRLTPGGLGLEFTSLLAVLSVALFVLIGYASIVSVDPGPTPGDEAAFEVAADLEATWLTDVSKVVTAFGSPTVTLALAALVAIGLAARRHWQEVVVLAVAVAIAHVAVPALKDAIDRRSGRDGRFELSQRSRCLRGDLSLAGGDDRRSATPGDDAGIAADRGRNRGRGGDRAEPRVPARAFPQRRQRRLGTWGVGVRALRDRLDAGALRRALAAELERPRCLISIPSTCCLGARA
jgi:hypothetical protein